MNEALCLLTEICSKFVFIYTIILLVYAVVSWIPDLRGRWTVYLAMLVEPVLTPLRRVLPAGGGLDWSFLVLILLLQFVVQPGLASVAGNVCFRVF